MILNMIKNIFKLFLQILLIFYLDLFKLNNKEEVSLQSLTENITNIRLVKEDFKNIELIQNLILKLNFNIN